MDRRSLEHFAAVAAFENFTRAAAALHISQPALSHSIRSLERELGMPLFVRRARGATLTDAGDRILDLARGILSDFDRIPVEARRNAPALTGTLHVTSILTLTIEPTTTILTRLSERHPGIDVVSFGHASAADALESVASGLGDVAIVAERDAVAIPAGLRSEALGSDEIVVATARRSPLAKLKHVDAAALATARLVAEPQGHALRDIVESLVGEAGVRGITEVTNRQALLPLVAQGAGAALIPAGLFRLEGRPEIVIRPLDPPIEMAVRMVAREDARPEVDAFAVIAREVARGSVE